MRIEVINRQEIFDVRSGQTYAIIIHWLKKKKKEKEKSVWHILFFSLLLLLLLWKWIIQIARIFLIDWLIDRSTRIAFFSIEFQLFLVERRILIDEKCLSRALMKKSRSIPPRSSFNSQQKSERRRWAKITLHPLETKKKRNLAKRRTFIQEKKTRNEIFFVFSTGKTKKTPQEILTLKDEEIWEKFSFYFY